jgi:hypothetical protein
VDAQFHLPPVASRREQVRTEKPVATQCRAAFQNVVNSFSNNLKNILDNRAALDSLGTVCAAIAYARKKRCGARSEGNLQAFTFFVSTRKISGVGLRLLFACWQSQSK